MKEFITFHGSDGCGKSTIARELVAQAKSDNVVRLIGGSSYREWLTPQIARETYGSMEIFETTPVGQIEKTRLYEAIGIACYGYANHLIDAGAAVVVDSDPVIKRLTWARTEQMDSFQTYSDQFGEMVSASLADSRFPSVVVGVDIDNPMAEDEHLSRIIERNGNSEYDPSSLEELRAIRDAVASIWGELKNSRCHESSVGIFNKHFADAKLIDVCNTVASPADLPDVVRHTARTILDEASD